MKQGLLLKSLKKTWIALVKAKHLAKDEMRDSEYSEDVLDAKAEFQRTWFACAEFGLDPTALCTQFIKKYL